MDDAKKSGGSFNLFNQSSSSKKPAKKHSAPSTTPPVQVAVTTLTDDQIQALFAKMYRMRDDLENQLDQMIEKSGYSKAQIFDYFNNPKNWTSSQWENLQQKREELEEKLLGKKKSELISMKKKQKLEEMTKDRKGKTLGSRKKWIPMR